MRCERNSRHPIRFLFLFFVTVTHLNANRFAPDIENLSLNTHFSSEYDYFNSTALEALESRTFSANLLHVLVAITGPHWRAFGSHPRGRGFKSLQVHQGSENSAFCRVFRFLTLWLDNPPGPMIEIISQSRQTVKSRRCACSSICNDENSSVYGRKRSILSPGMPRCPRFSTYTHKTVQRGS